MIQIFAGHKRKYDELLDQTERKERQRAEAKKVTGIFRCEQRARRQDALRELDKELNKKDHELTTVQSALRSKRRRVESLERSLQCLICGRKQ
jgi:hypothetical protein